MYSVQIVGEGDGLPSVAHSPRSRNSVRVASRTVVTRKVVHADLLKGETRVKRTSVLENGDGKYSRRDGDDDGAAKNKSVKCPSEAIRDWITNSLSAHNSPA